MRSLVTLQFLEEVRSFDLRFTCDDCAHLVTNEDAAHFVTNEDAAHFVTNEDAAHCLHGYPLGERRARVLSVGDHVEFCKEFEGTR